MANSFLRFQNENTLLKEMHRILRDDGYVLLTVPAFQFLYSKHDKEHGHFRRYNKQQLEEAMIRNGYIIEKSSYFNSILFPALGFARLIEKFFKISLDNGEPPQKSINKLLYKIFSSERKLLKKYNFKYGLSLVVIAKKDNGGEWDKKNNR